MLSLWLGILSIVPFNMSTLENNEHDGQSFHLSNRLILCFTRLLENPGPVREVAAFGLSNFLNRPDVFVKHLDEFVNWAVVAFRIQPHDAERPYFAKLGALSAANQLLKRGDRNKIISIVPALYEGIMQIDATTDRSLERKLLSKVLQRVAVCLLPQREASWRYQRGMRTLLNSSTTALSVSVSIGEVEPKANESEENDDVVEEIDSILEAMLKFLGDSDTIIRWSAAKGIGRICMRVPRSFAQDIVNAVLHCFEDEDDDANWHGACLALAELTRRGLVLPNKLPDIIPFLEKALLFNIQKGQHGIGANVRDAACYVCWAFSRAYPASDLYPIISGLRMSLIITALFDREVNCRRAASAAFQEMVGRLGAEAIPFGIDIFTLADYVSVGNRTQSYLRIAPSVAILDPISLCGPFLSFLANRNCFHWDRDIRELSSSAIAAIIYRCRSPAVPTLESLISYLDGGNPMFRHGSLLGLAKGIVASRMLGEEMSEPFIQRMDVLVPSLDKNRLFRGKGGELMREGTCTLIENMARVRFPWTGKTLLLVIEIVNENLRQPNEILQRKAQAALRQLIFNYFSEKSWDVEPTDRLSSLTVGKYLLGLQKENNVAITRGYALGLGALPSRLALLPTLKMKEIFQVLASFADPQRKFNGEMDAETNRNCVEAVVELSERLLTNPLFSFEDFNLCYDAIIQAGYNYSTDKRGDTGSWSRLLALDGVVRVLEALRLRLNLVKKQEQRSLNKQFSTVFGCGEVLSTKTVTSDLTSISLAYPVSSLGQAQLNNDNENFGYFEEEEYTKESRQSNKSPICIVRTEALQALDMNYIFSERSGNSWWECDDRFLDKLFSQALSLALRQLAEKLDNVRFAASKAIMQLIDLHHRYEEMGFHAQSCQAVVEVLINWRSLEKATNFNTVCQAEVAYDFVTSVMLHDRSYMKPVFGSLVTSVGGITEATSVHATAALLNACKNELHHPIFIDDIFSCILQLLDEYCRKDRVILPLLKTIEILFTNNIFSVLSIDKREFFIVNLSLRFNKEAKSTSNIRKLCVLLDLNCVLIQSCSQSANTSIAFLVNFLGHRFPKVRKCKYLFIKFFLWLIFISISFRCIRSPVHANLVGFGSSCNCRRL